MLPNLIIAGVPRSGTTSLFSWLADHPQAVGSRVKETFYFNDPTAHSFDPAMNFRDHGLGAYETFWPKHSDAKLILESTPQYIYQETALRELPDLASRPKFIFVLRNPADQILSSYRYFRSNWNHLDPQITFAQYVELARVRSDKLARNELLRFAFDNCEYEKHLERWYERAGRERVVVYLNEDLKRKRDALVKNLAIEAGIDPSFYDTYDFPVENESRQFRSHTLQQINIRLRAMVPLTPRHPLWKAARSVYRLINMPRYNPEELSEADQQAYRGLKEQFQPAYSAITARYALPEEPARPANAVLAPA